MLKSVQPQQTFVWTCPTNVLQWVATLPRTRTTFVANRVSEKQQVLLRSNWNRVPSSTNPANCSSRGTTLNTEIIIYVVEWSHLVTETTREVAEISNTNDGTI